MFFLKNSVRREIKFKIFIKDIGKFYSWLYNSPFKRKYENRSVNSLYYDTLNLDFANDNISGQSSRIKIRTRWYTKNNENFLDEFCKSKYFRFEIKRKKNNYSDKIFFPKQYSEIKNSAIDQRTFLKKELNNEICKFSELSHLILKDTMFVGYNREYYEHTSLEHVRLTIDKDLSCLICSKIPNSKNTKISNNFIIVEIKFNQKNENLLKNILKKFPFRQIRSSKYLYAISKYYRLSY
jgi:hypothetical protein